VSELRAEDASTGTIAAIASPPGRGGVGIVRVSGPSAGQIAVSVIGRSLPPPRHASLVPFRGSDGQLIDRGLLLYFAAPASFTGEDVVEFHAHGGPVVLALLLDACLAAGARLARAGEFSLRAFLNGKLDLLQAEATADLIAAGSVRAARAAMRSLEGAFSQRVQTLKDQVISLRVQVEAAIDFGSEDIEPAAASSIIRQGQGVAEHIAALRRDAEVGVRAGEGLRVVLVGAPNVGKSTLLNQLAQRNTAIVTPMAGTTRDIVREQLVLDGIAVELLDTAGLRSEASLDPVEEEGIRRARGLLPAADLVLLVIDAAIPPASRVLPMLASALALDAVEDRILIIVNKVDISGEPAGWRDGMLHVSGTTGAGIDLLRRHLADIAGAATDGGAFAARRRHVASLDAALAALRAGLGAMNDHPAIELLAEDLRIVQRHLGELVGDVSADDLLGAIFATFCIGK